MTETRALHINNLFADAEVLIRSHFVFANQDVTVGL